MKTFKVVQSSRVRSIFNDLFYKTLKTSWLKFFFVSALFYVLLNFLFALIYVYSPAEISNSNSNSIWDAFVFSFQTSSTLGYGHMLPNSDLAHIIVLLDTIMGIFYVAIITGLAFSKFARPSANIIFSNNAILSTFDNTPTLMFRLGNARDTHIVNAILNVAVLLPYTSKEGHKISRLHELKLVTNNLPSFALTLTAMHLIDKQSPLYGLKIEDFLSKNIIIFVSFTGIDDIISQTVNASKRYLSTSIIEANKFTDILSIDKNNNYSINLNKIHDYETNN